MHLHNIHKWKQDHTIDVDYHQNARKTWFVLIITILTMIVELIAGKIYNSMALFADGLHMTTHVAAFIITIFSYWYATKNLKNPAFSFSTGKVSVLGSFASAVALGIVSIFMIIESIERFLEPLQIQFNEAILVAAIGFIVNGISVVVLQAKPGKDGHNHLEHDHNLKAAYFHVLADTLTSIFAIAALLIGKYYSVFWVDPLMGLIGAIIIIKWSYNLVMLNSRILLDKGAAPQLKNKIINIIEADSDNMVIDFHAWHLSPRDISIIVSIVTHHPKEPNYYKELIKPIKDFKHITIEINKCDDPSCYNKK